MVFIQLYDKLGRQDLLLNQCIFGLVFSWIELKILEKYIKNVIKFEEYHRYQHFYFTLLQ